MMIGLTLTLSAWHIAIIIVVLIAISAFIHSMTHPEPGGHFYPSGPGCGGMILFTLAIVMLVGLLVGKWIG